MFSCHQSLQKFHSIKEEFRFLFSSWMINYILFLFEEVHFFHELDQIFLFLNFFFFHFHFIRKIFQLCLSIFPTLFSTCLEYSSSSLIFSSTVIVFLFLILF